MNIRPRRLSTLGLSVLITAAGAVACTTGGGGGSGGGGGGLEAFAGWAALEWNVFPGGLEGGLAGTFFHGSGGNVSIGGPSFGCVDIASMSGNVTMALSPTPVMTGFSTPSENAGASVQFENGATTIAIPNNFGGTYTTNPPSQPPGGDYDLVVAGGVDVAAQTLTAALFMPELPTLPGMTTIAVSGSGITWTPAGGDFVIVALLDTLGPGDTPVSDLHAFCITNDDGAFTLPASVLDDVPNGTGTLLIESRSQREATLEGRTMLFFGDVVNSGPYTK